MRRARVQSVGVSIAVLAALAIFMVGGASPARAGEPAPGPAGWLFDPGKVVEIDLGLPPASIAALEAAPEEEYMPGTFELRVDGVAQGPPLGAVGIRLKGGLGSFRPLGRKAAFKVKFDEFADDQTYFGLEKLTLNNMVQDPTTMREALAYEAFRAVGVAAPRTGYALVRVNGDLYGLYLNVETLDEIALSRWFASTRHLYEGSYGADARTGAPPFEVDEGSKKDLGDLKALTAAAEDDDGDWSEGMAGFADLGQMTRMWAVERIVGHWDSYSGQIGSQWPNNYYLHSDTEGRFRMLPWGTDQTWEVRLGFDQAGAGLLFARCMADASCAAAYRDALQQAGATIAGLDLAARVDSLAAQLAPCQALELAPRREYTAVEIAEALARLRGFVADRPTELAVWLGGAPAGPLSGPLPGSTPAGVCALHDLSPRVPLPGGAGSASMPGSPPAPIERRLRIGSARLVGRAVATVVELPHAGQVTQRVTFSAARGKKVACADREARDRAARLTMRCGLSAATLRRIERGPLALRVQIDFAPPAGRREVVRYRLVLPEA